ncbi:MAG: autotransporter assembly complex protein TamA [Gammaproteobacteria bacterium]|nr:outer membrane protein assembly factor [Rhodocyclaceae bacterium]MBU3910340.1 autotransporter assembly complex protein TamA [Gammaproteobacteria bacterium]MBU3990270.1 autotransporter assembly complex protein TamA [Gammaproteobacteria bacterium]MBU4004167.1 autotransporter assembly complex protein TamA [Gammaproteobacteria bacterium]MBU4020414.1 autotransporter assembly complex protein TamA [Gammaproteobacteria bacterium]
MRLSALAGLAWGCCLALLATAQVARAADAPASLEYDITLKVPEDQRKLLVENLDLYRWQGNDRMSEAQLRRLVRMTPQQIRGFLATEGYFSPRIEAEIEHQDKDGRWEVSLAVDPGKPARVTAFDLQVTGAFADGSPQSQVMLEKMRSEWSLRPAAVFRQDDWEAAKRNALKALLLDQYPAATIASSRATVDPEADTVELQLIIDSGPAFTFGSLAIQGLNRYPASLVQRINPIVAGEPYAQAKLLELQSRLQDSPYFASATVGVASDPAQPMRVPIQVEVAENPSRKLGFGIGVSTDTGARGQMDYRDLNLFDRAWRLGGAIKLEQKRQSFGGDLQWPMAADGSRDSINALVERTDIEGEITEKLSLGAKRSFVKGKTESTYGLRYLTERQMLAGAPSDNRAALSPFYAWTLRNVDHLLYPTRGYLFSFQTDVAARALLSDQDFLRGHGRGVYFHPLGERGQLILRGELGAVAARSRDGIPSDYLFRTGGDQTVRGYAYQGLGITAGSAVVGGRYLAVASAEYVHWLTGQWGTAAFVDAGNAADSLRDLTPVYGVGVGVRWKSPVGPLNLDLAYGENTRELRLHFSVGFGF